MIDYSCKYWIGDDDCLRCEKKGYFHGGCDWCEENESGLIKTVEEIEKSEGKVIIKIGENGL